MRRVAALGALALVLAGCAHGAPRLAPSPLDALAPDALTFAAEQYRRAASSRDPASGYPRSTRADGSWRTVGISDWTSGFFPGVLWQLAQYTGDAELRRQAERWTWPLAPIVRGSYDHDLGFQYMSSFGQGLRVTRHTSYRAPLHDAARHLAGRFDPRVGVIRSWNWGEWQYPVIIDNLMNLELLLWSARNGGDPSNIRIVRSHADRTLENHVRADGGSFHVVDYDSVSGRVLRRMTRQGFADSSTWARGQAWGIYGFTMLYRETGEPRYLRTAQQLADHVLPRLPADGVPCWDYQAPGCPDSAPRDASAAAIMAAALLELGGQVPADARARYHDAAVRMLTSLASQAYLARGTHAQSILLHAVGDYPRNGEIDVGITYADYYFVEALLRYLALRRD